MANVKLSFDDGYKTIEFNGDPEKVIRINPTDPNFINRISGIKDKAKEIAEKYGDIDLSALDKLKEINDGDDEFEHIKAAAETAKKIEVATRELIDSIFEQPVCDVVFGKSSCLTPVNGRPMYMGFLEAVIDYMAGEVNKNTADRRKKMKQYTNKAKQISIKPVSTSTPVSKPFIPLAQPKPEIEIDSMTAEQKNELLKRLLS